MRIQRLGERAVILRDLPCEAYLLAKALNSSRDKPFVVVEAVSSYETVGVYLSESAQDLPGLEDWIESHVADCDALRSEVRKHVLPVCYELGEDLDQAALSLGVPSDRLIELHSDQEYQCFAVGFSPGFAYLGYLQEEIATLPRLPTPRTRVPAGSVGITGRQTAVYPSATPGGWNLIGRCPLTLVDPSDEYFPIEPGDKVEFRRIDEAEYQCLEGSRL